MEDWPRFAVLVADLMSRIPINLGFVVRIEDPLAGTVHILILAGSQRPQEHCEGPQAHQDSDGNGDREAAHAGLSSSDASFVSATTLPADQRSRMALITTISDDEDIATAAMSGVTCPEMASGTAIAL